MSVESNTETVYIGEIQQFLSTLNEEVGISQQNQDKVSTDYVEPEIAREYIKGIFNGETNRSVKTWEENNQTNGLYNPNTLQPWESQSSPYYGRLSIETDFKTEDGICYNVELLAEDFEGEKYEIEIFGWEEDYNGSLEDFEGNPNLSNVFRQAGV